VCRLTCYRRVVEDRSAPRSGEWWFTVRCDRCSRSIHAYRDETEGDKVIRLDGPGEVELTCPSCGHRAGYPATKLRSQRVP